MKFVKFGIFALSMGLFVASCGDSANDSTETTDSTTIMTTPEPMAPAMDTTTAMPADTAAMPTTDTATMAH